MAQQQTIDSCVFLSKYTLGQNEVIRVATQMRTLCLDKSDNQ